MAIPQDDWDQHWHRYAESAGTNPAEAYRRRLVLGLLRVGGRPARILDIGSGQGDLAIAIEERHPAAEVLGIELSREGVELAGSKAARARFVQQDLLAATDPPAELREWATHAVCSEVLEHLDEPERLLNNAMPYLAPGCRVIVTVPGGPRSAFDRHIGHRRHYRRHELRAVLERAGLHVERVSAAGFPFFNLYRLAVILRGAKLVDDVASGGEAPASRAALAVMRVFDVLFAANLRSSPWGWQMVAEARVPAR